MRGLLVPSVLMALALAAACATSSPITTSNGGSPTSTTGGLPTSVSVGAGGSPFGGTGGGTRSCGVNSTNIACNSCIQADCCYFAHTCAGDPTCLDCAARSSPPSSCNHDEAYVSFIQCATSRCSVCFGGSSAGPTSTTSSGAGTTTAASSSSVTTTSSGGTGATSGTGGSGGGSTGVGGSGGGITGTGGGTGSSGGPTSCDGADWAVGCCDPSGDVWYCDSFGTLNEQKCDSGKTCGWNPWVGYYDCVKAPGGADPSGFFPKACGP